MDNLFAESIIQFLIPLARRLRVSPMLLRKMPAAAKDAYDKIMDRLGVEDPVVAKSNFFYKIIISKNKINLKKFLKRKIRRIIRKINR